MNFFAELKRRHIYRVAAAYAVVAWVLLQLVNNLLPIFELPSWVGRAVVLLLILGFPITLLIAWLRELAPADGATERATTGKLDYVLIGALVVVISLVSYQQLAPTRASNASPQVQASVSSVRTVANSPTSAISVAVLPFANLSSDKEQEFFSDGMTDEISGALAKIPDLRVVGRASAFQFKGGNKDLTAIGQALHTTHLIEGSVRKAGNRVRISAELVQADNGLQVWSNSYDRELTDVFAIQEDIATAIAGAFHMSLGLKAGEQLVSNRAIDPSSYEQFLRGKAALLRARAAYADQIAILEPVVAKNPDYAPAWAALAQAYRFASQFARFSSPEERKRQQAFYEQKRDSATRRAVELDPIFVEGKVMLARIQSGPRRLALTEDILSTALASDPNNPDALNYYSGLLVLVGRIKEGVAMIQQVHQLEPYAGLYTGNLAQTLWMDGQTNAAISLWKDNLNVQGTGSYQGLARIYASLGRYKDAADLADQALSVTRYQILSDTITTFARLMRTAPAKAVAPETLPRLGDLSFVYLYIGAPERALEPFEEGNQTYNDISLLWHPTYAPVKKTERFKKILRDAGLVQYWRERGWPNFCHPATGDDFDCN